MIGSIGAVRGTGRGILLCVVVLVTLLIAPASFAQGNRIITLGEEVVEGRLEKPEAFYILQPTNLNYEQAELEESFIPELLRTVEEAPF
ncbi:MAG: hypothetical protein KC561_05490 [Myxococcales bacterium]|nr:hypothetical protein [Myxococcales bacterium]